MLKKSAAQFEKLPDRITNKQEFMKAVADSGLSKESKTISALFRNAIEISITPTDKSKLKTDESKIGGVPDLPRGMKWPDYQGKPLSFIAQFRLADIAKYDKDSLLPKTGMLYFFYDAEEQPGGFEIADKGKWKVIYDATGTSLVTLKPPVTLAAEYQFKPLALTFASKDTFPSEYTPFVKDLSIKPQLTNIIWILQDNRLKGSDNYGSHLLGHPDEVQNDMYEECQLASNGVYCGGPEGYNDPRTKSLIKGATNWQLLLQVGSYDDMMWGDMGVIYFWITKNDLKKHDFNKVWVIMQCG